MCEGRTLPMAEIREQPGRRRGKYDAGCDSWFEEGKGREGKRGAKGVKGRRRGKREVKGRSRRVVGSLRGGGVARGKGGRRVIGKEMGRGRAGDKEKGRDKGKRDGEECKG